MIFLMKDTTPPKNKLSLCKVGTLLPMETLQDHFSKEKRHPVSAVMGAHTLISNKGEAMVKASP